MCTKAVVVFRTSSRDRWDSCTSDRGLELPRLPGGGVVTETVAQELIFTLRVAQEIASRESPDYDLVLLFIQKALEVATEEASRHGIMVDFDDVSEREH